MKFLRCSHRLSGMIQRLLEEATEETSIHLFRTNHFSEMV